MQVQAAIKAVKDFNKYEFEFKKALNLLSKLNYTYKLSQPIQIKQTIFLFTKQI